ncbi:MAG: two-component system, chemotaxis family, sensor kinase CheA [Gaiellales bacterium]|nr:two-component system, chemotaxis family, sensor kinase CheA [Gaiellales bacterium]
MSQPESEFIGIFRDEANERLDSISAALLAIERGEAPSQAVNGLFRDAHTIKGGAGMLGLDEIGRLAHAVEDVLADARTAGEISRPTIDPLLRAGDALRALINGSGPPADDVTALIAELARGGEAAPPSGEAAPPSGDEAPPSGEEAPPTGDEAATDAEGVSLRLVRERRADAASSESAPARERRGQGTTRGRSVRVPAEKLDALLDLVGETVLHRQRLGHMVAAEGLAQSEALSDELDVGDRLLGALQDAAIRTRTLPFGSITGPLPRAVRDIAIAEGKKVELVVEGTETDLDRVILEGLSEPLAHLLRNAVAHGLESPADRVAAGKDERGRVTLSARQRSGLVAVTVSDDGRGISHELAARASGGGSLVDILARPGFSTHADVSDLAGRGVGLDAVKIAAESFGGSMEIVSAPGNGMTITLLLPLTLALLDVLLVERGSHVFGVPLASVQEAVSVVESEILSLSGRNGIELRGSSIPFADIADLLGLDAPPLAPRTPTIVLSAGGRRVALACDRLVGESEVVVKQLGPLLEAVRGYVGAAILGDGRVALLLDPALATASRERLTARAAEAAPGAETGRTLLVVEDSFMVRELQRSILEAAGYTVESAKNGREALERLSANSGIELVVTDLDMPEMDGLTLTRAIRAHDEWRSLPIVVVTSRASDDDRRRGVEAGADAYMVKDSFDQHALLEIVAEMVGE